MTASKKLCYSDQGRLTGGYGPHMSFVWRPAIEAESPRCRTSIRAQTGGCCKFFERQLRARKLDFDGDMAAPRTRHSDFDWAWDKTAVRRRYWRCPVMPGENGSRSVLVFASIVIGPILMPINVVK